MGAATAVSAMRVSGANTPQYQVPGQAFGNAAFGTVAAQANGPRQVQFGLKLYY